MYPENANPCMHQSAIFALCAMLSKYSQSYTRCSASQDEPDLHNMQLKLHNSADRGISKFSYLHLRLVACFYPQSPTWPWLWGHTYRQIACVEWYSSLTVILSLDQIIQIQFLQIWVWRPWENHLIEGAPFISRSVIDHPDWHEQQRFFAIIVRSLHSEF